jgi:hypothetical protein
VPSAKNDCWNPWHSVHKSKKFWPNAEIEILNRRPTTVSKLMESEDPEEPTYGSAWRRKPYFLTAGTWAPPVARDDTLPSFFSRKVRLGLYHLVLMV